MFVAVCAQAQLKVNEDGNVSRRNHYYKQWLLTIKANNTVTLGGGFSCELGGSLIIE